MSAYEYVTNTFLLIAGEINITVAVVNNKVIDDFGELVYKTFKFVNYSALTEWLRINKNKYYIDSKQMLYLGVASGLTIYVNEVKNEI